MKITAEIEPKQDSEGYAIPSRTPKSEKEKLQEMSFRDKMWYIANYYKMHIIGVLLGILVISQVAHIMYLNTFEDALYCVYLNSVSIDPLNTAPLEEDFASTLNLTSKQSITSESLYASYGDSSGEMDYATITKIVALIAAKELDVIIADEDNIKYHANMSACIDFETLLPADLLAVVKDRLYYAVDAETGESHAFGIDISGTKFAEDSNLGQTPPYLYIINNSQRIDTAVDLIAYIFDVEV